MKRCAWYQRRIHNNTSTWLNFQWRHNLIKCTFLLHTWPFPSPNPSSKPNLTCTTVQCTIYDLFLLGRTTSNVKFWHVSLYLDILKSRDLSSIAKLVHTHPQHRPQKLYYWHRLYSPTCTHRDCLSNTNTVTVTFAVWCDVGGQSPAHPTLVFVSLCPFLRHTQSLSSVNTPDFSPSLRLTHTLSVYFHYTSLRSRWAVFSFSSIRGRIQWLSMPLRLHSKLFHSLFSLCFSHTKTNMYQPTLTHTSPPCRCAWITPAIWQESAEACAASVYHMNKPDITPSTNNVKGHAMRSKVIQLKYIKTYRTISFTIISLW